MDNELGVSQRAAKLTYLLMTSERGLTARDISTRFGVSSVCAYRLMERIEGVLPVEVDTRVNEDGRNVMVFRLGGRRAK
jgi:predicted ArsR family transcriptional regulator